MLDILNVNKRAVIILLVFIALDVLTGITKAVLDKELRSCTLREGLLKKMLEIIVVIVAFGCDYLLEVSYVGNFTLFTFCGMEGVSICENVGNYIPLPEKLRDILKTINSRGDKNDI